MQRKCQSPMSLLIIYYNSIALRQRWIEVYYIWMTGSIVQKIVIFLVLFLITLPLESFEFFRETQISISSFLHAFAWFSWSISSQKGIWKEKIVLKCLCVMESLYIFTVKNSFFTHTQESLTITTYKLNKNSFFSMFSSITWNIFLRNSSFYWEQKP